MIRQVKKFHVIVMQWQQRNVQKYLMLVQSCCFHTYPVLFEKGYFFLRWSLPSTLTNAVKNDHRKYTFSNKITLFRVEIFENVLAFLLRVDGRKRFRIRNTMMSSIIYSQHNACSIIKLSYFHRFNVFVWTGDYDSNMLRVVAYLFENGGKNLRHQKYPDTCGRGKTYCFFAVVVVA